MPTKDINYKIRKYSLKLKNANSEKKANLYKTKINFYNNIMQNGGANGGGCGCGSGYDTSENITSDELFDSIQEGGRNYDFLKQKTTPESIKNNILKFFVTNKKE